MKRIRHLLLILTAAILILTAATSVYAYTLVETTVSTASDGCTMLGVYGTYYTDTQTAVDRINEIRLEACTSGNTPDPRNASRMLTESDYVPIQWSTSLEKIARIRAAEGGLAYGLLGSGHNRLNGQSIWSVQYGGISSSSENLAYNRDTGMIHGIDQWYSERSIWVNQGSGTTGHYTSMINPNFKYVGLGDFYTEASAYPNTLSGQFSSQQGSLGGEFLPGASDVMQKIEVLNDYISGYYLDGKKTLYLDTEETLVPRASLKTGTGSTNLWVIDDVTYTSSNPSVATVSGDGTVTAVSKGTTTITAKTAAGTLATLDITVSCDHNKVLQSSTPSTCQKHGTKVYTCTKCGETITETLPFAAHDYVYGTADASGIATGVCSVCGDTVSIAPPTAFTVYWRNNVTATSSYYTTRFPEDNPVGSILDTMFDVTGSDANYKEMVLESSDESIASVDGESLNLNKAGIVLVTVYPKYNKSLARTYTLRVGSEGDLNIGSARIELSQDTYAYSGSARKPSVTAFVNDVELSAGTDYTVSYKDNIKAGTARVILTGQGLFSSSVEKTFSIEPLSIRNATVTLSKESYECDGTAKEPSVTVYAEGFSLGSEDYTVEYKDNIKPGTATVTITGKGNFTGSVQKTFTMTHTTHAYEKAVLEEATCAREGTIRFTCTICGEFYEETIEKLAHTPVTDPAVSATCTEDGLTEGSHCSVCGEVLKAQEKIPAAHDYAEKLKTKAGFGTAGSYETVCSVCGDVKSTRDIAAVADILLDKDTFVYTGGKITPQVTIKDTDGKTLSESEDYTVQYADNTNCGTAGVTVTLRGIYEGSQTANFTIRPLSIENAKVTLSKDSYECDGTAKEPAVTVELGEQTLGTKDYKVEYKDNIKPGTATVTITGQGNYTGSIQKTFTMAHTKHAYEKTVLEEATCSKEGTARFTCTICGDAYEEAIEKTAHTPVTDPAVGATCTEDGLTEGSHCSVCGEVLKAQETIPAAHDYVEQPQTKAGFGTAGEIKTVCSRCGDVKGTKTIAPVNDIALDHDSFVYTGGKITPQVTIKDTDGKTLSESEDYTVQYADNTNCGTATVTVKLTGSYEGSQTAVFTILPAKSAITTVTAGKKKMTVKFDNQKASGISGYELQYRIKGKGAWKTVKLGASAKSKAIKKLKKGKKYQVRLRAFCTIDGVKVYGAYSKTKVSAKIK